MNKIHFFKNLKTRSKSAKSSHHKTLNLSENLAKSQFSEKKSTLFITNYISSEKNHSFCFDHNKEFSVFCFDCSTFFCLDCHSNKHKSHKIAAKGPLDSFFRSQINENLKKIQEISTGLSTLIEINNKSHNNLLHNNTSSIMNIKEFYRNLREILNIQEIEYLKSLQINFERVYGKFLEKAKDLSFLKGQIKDLKEGFNGFEVLDHEIPDVFSKIKKVFTGFETLQSQDVSQKINEIFELYDLTNNSKLTKNQETFMNENRRILEEIEEKFMSFYEKKPKSLNFFRKNVKFKPKGPVSQINLFNYIKESGLNGHKAIDLKKNDLESSCLSIKTHFYQSQILKNKLLLGLDQEKIWPKSIKMANLLYQMSSEEVSSERMHLKCDGFGPYMALIHCNKYYVFGFFCPFSFQSKEIYEKDENIYIFSLCNRNGCKTNKFPLKKEKNYMAFHQSLKSPCLGCEKLGKADLFIE